MKWVMNGMDGGAVQSLWELRRQCSSYKKVTAQVVSVAHHSALRQPPSLVKRAVLLSDRVAACDGPCVHGRVRAARRGEEDSFLGLKQMEDIGLEDDCSMRGGRVFYALLGGHYCH
jgi:hypothetical protein